MVVHSLDSPAGLKPDNEKGFDLIGTKEPQNSCLTMLGIADMASTAFS